MATTTVAAHHRSREEVGRIHVHAGHLPGTEAAPGLAAGPDALDLPKTLRNPVPEFLGHDAERLVVTDHPLGLPA